ncbi:MAG: tetratricopeptide repeat protein [Solirubrobacterales bacterium]
MSVVAEPMTDELLGRVDRHVARSEWGQACKLLSGAGEEVRVLGKLAFCLSRAKRYEEAIAVLERLRSREPQRARWPYMLGYQLYVQERYEEALPYFIAAWRLDQGHMRNLYRLAQTRLHLGQADRACRGAAEILRLYHQLPPEARERETRTFARASYLLGREQLKRNPVSAVELLEQAAEHEPKDADKHYLLGKALRKAGRAKEAVVPLRQARRLAPAKAYVELELAVALARCEDGGREADEILDKLERRLGDWQALKGAGLAARLGQAERARRLLERAARKSFIRRSPAYSAVAEQVDAVGEPIEVTGESVSAPPSSAEAEADLHTGRVDMVNPKRGFGFLVDDTDQTRRYFKLRDLPVRRGGQVAYHPLQGEKGPAADVTRIRH